MPQHLNVIEWYFCMLICKTVCIESWKFCDIRVKWWSDQYIHLYAARCTYMFFNLSSRSLRRRSKRSLRSSSPFNFCLYSFMHSKSCKKYKKNRKTTSKQASVWEEGMGKRNYKIKSYWDTIQIKECRCQSSS